LRVVEQHGGIIYEARKDETTCTFIAGAPAMVLSNMSLGLSVANGSLVTMEGLSGIKDADRDRIRGAGPGELVILSSPPKYVLVSSESISSSSLAPQLQRIRGVPVFPIPAEKASITVTLPDEKVHKIGFSRHSIDLCFAATVMLAFSAGMGNTGTPRIL
jgi:hypothetical protein